MTKMSGDITKRPVTNLVKSFYILLEHTVS